jgi:beta-alanine degradation protein BauB
MNLSNIVVCILLALGVGCGATPSPRAADAVSAGTTVKIPADKIQFVHSGIVQHGGEILLGPAFGDIKTGKHGTFLHFQGQWASLLHSHTYDYFAVVVKGTVANPEQGEADVPLPPGSYWYQKGGEPHATKCISAEECLVFLVSDHAFDAQVLEKE